jgi:hypothetical protein
MALVLLAVWTLSPAAAAIASARRPAPPAPQRFAVRLVDVPVAAATNPRALRYIVDYLPTGTVVHRRILIMNQEAKTARFTVYSDAAQISQGLFIGGAGQTRSELTGWISVQHRVVTLGPRASVMDMVTIKVPRGATRGEQYAVIWVQQSAYLRSADGFAIDDVARVGIRVYLAVGRGGAPPTIFAITSITGRRSASGQPSILVHVANTGGRAVDLNGTVRLTGGPGNSGTGPFPAKQIITLAPGQSGNMTFALPKSLPGGSWQVRAALVSGLTTCVATATVQFSGALASQAGLSTMAMVALTLAAALLIATVMALVVARAAARRRHLPA